MSGRRPLYPRLLRLRHVHPSGWQRAVLGEGALAFAVVLVLADLATAWTLLVLPVAVAVVVKSHDVLAGLLAPPTSVSTAGQPEVRADAEQGGEGSDRDTAPQPDSDRDTAPHADSDGDTAPRGASGGTPSRTRTPTPAATRTRRSRPGRPVPDADPADRPGTARSSSQG